MGSTSPPRTRPRSFHHLWRDGQGDVVVPDFKRLRGKLLVGPHGCAQDSEHLNRALNFLRNQGFGVVSVDKRVGTAHAGVEIGDGGQHHACFAEARQHAGDVVEEGCVRADDEDTGFR